MLGFDGEYPGATQKTNFDIGARKLQKSAVKHSIEKKLLYLTSRTCIRSFVQDFMRR